MDFLATATFVALIFLSITIFLVLYRDKLKKFLKKQWRKLFVIGVVGVLTTTGVLFLLPPTGDNPVIPEPYIYYTMPDNSFGSGDFKVVNWSYFKEFFKQGDSIDWLLEYKRYSYSDWTNGNQYLTIGKDWKEEGFWKITLNFSCPVDVYTARFTLGLDKSCIDSYDRDETEVLINFSIPNTDEIYPMMFNWSDLKNIPGLVFSKGFKSGVFWFRFQKYIIPQGFYSFDPSFGYIVHGVIVATVENYIQGMAFTAPENGLAYNITVWLCNTDALTSYDDLVKCAMYYNSNKTFISGTSSHIYDILPANGSQGFYTYEFAVEVPIFSGVSYLICAWGASGGGVGCIVSDVGIYSKVYDSETYDGTFPTTFSVDGTTANRNMSIYCCYNATGAGGWTNTAPSANCFNPTNSSMGQDLNKIISTCVNDTDGNSTTVNFYSNQSGSWLLYQTNNSVTANSTVYWTANVFNTGSTMYWWNVTVDDGNVGGNRSFWQYYTTKANATIEYASNLTIRNDGVDYFVWLGENTSAYNVSTHITGFDEIAEYIGVQGNDTWSNTNGSWIHYHYADKSGTNFSVKTFDVIEVYLTDAGTQVISMYENESWNYTNSKSYTWVNNTKNKGYNYTGYNRMSDTTLSAINTSATLQSGEFIGLWNKTSYSWVIYNAGIGITDDNVAQWDVIISKVEDTETWNT